MADVDLARGEGRVRVDANIDVLEVGKALGHQQLLGHVLRGDADPRDAGHAQLAGLRRWLGSSRLGPHAEEPRYSG
jgi:hypothetical protein